MYFSPKVILVIVATSCSLQIPGDCYRREEGETQVLYYSVMDRDQKHVATSSEE